jgi:hypothetical protein
MWATTEIHEITRCQYCLCVTPTWHDTLLIQKHHTPGISLLLVHEFFLRYSKLAGDHAKALHDERVAFPPRTREVPFDEKGAFVAKKEKNRDPGDPDDDRRGDHWDHVAFDPEHRLVVSVVPGKRTLGNAQRLVDDFQRRTRGRFMHLMTQGERILSSDVVAIYA